MGRLVKPNWGRSAPVVRAAAAGPPVELIRVQLPEPTDFTIYIGNITDDLVDQRVVFAGADSVIENQWTLSWGNGGTMREHRDFQTVRGTVVHVAASSIILTQPNRITPTIPDSVLAQLRISAMAAVGRPTPYTKRAELAVGTALISAGETAYVRLSPWATDVLIMSSVASAGGDPALVDVTQMFRDSTPANSHQSIAMSLSSYATKRGLSQFANVLQLVNNSPGDVAIDMTETILL